MRPIRQSFRGLLPDGTLRVGIGLAVLGLASFVHLAVAGHTLSPAGMASVSVLWSLVFLIGLGLFFPVEQELIRLIAVRKTTGQGITPVVWRGAALTGAILAVVLIPLALAARPIAGALFAGDTGMVGALAGAFLAMAVVSVSRGVLAGSGRFTAYGGQLAADGLVRIGSAAALGAAGIRSPLLFGLILTLAPLVSALVTLWPLVQELGPGPTVPWAQLSRGLGLLIGSTILSQIVVNVGVINARLLSPGDAAAVGALLSAMILARVPLFIFASLQASLLPGLAGAVAAGKYARFRKLIVRGAATVTGLGIVGGIVAVVLGPWLIRVLFAARPLLGAADFAWLASGTLLYMLAMVLGQGVLAVSRHRDQLSAWAAGTVVLAIATFMPGAVTLRVEAAFTLSSLTVCLGLAVALARHRTVLARLRVATAGAAYSLTVRPWKPSMIPRITAIVPAFGAEQWLDDAVRALRTSKDVDVDVVVVDNGCTSDAIDRVKALDRVRVITPDTNTGYTGGCIRGAAEATGDFLAFVNSDAIAAPEALARLAAVAGEPGVGFAMGSIRLADDPNLINTSGNPLHFTGISWAGGFAEPAEHHAERTSVLVGSGCFFVIRRDLWEAVGGFAEEYFAYSEDTELSIRLWHRGLTIEYVPDAVILHHYEFSRNELKFYLLERNRAMLVLTTYELRTLLVLAPMLLLVEVLMLGTAVAGGWGRAKLRAWRWLWQHRRYVSARRSLLQQARLVPDSVILQRVASLINPANVAAPPGIGILNAIMHGYWSVASRALVRSGTLKTRKSPPGSTSRMTCLAPGWAQWRNWASRRPPVRHSE